MGAGVAQLTAAASTSVVVIGDDKLLEKFALATCAVTTPELVGSPPVAVDETLTVTVTASLVLKARGVVLVQVNVPTVQIQPPPAVESVIAVAVTPGGNVMVKVVFAGSGLLELVFSTVAVMVSVVSPSLNCPLAGSVAMLIDAVGAITAVTKLDRSNRAYSSIFSCAISVSFNVGHSAGNIWPAELVTAST